MKEISKIPLSILLFFTVVLLVSSCNRIKQGDKLYYVEPELMALLKTRAKSEWELHGASGTVRVTEYTHLPSVIYERLGLETTSKVPITIDFSYLGPTDYCLTCRSEDSAFSFECKGNRISVDSCAAVPFEEFLEDMTNDDYILWPLDVIRQHLYPVTMGLLLTPELVTRFAGMSVVEVPPPPEISDSDSDVSLICIMESDDNQMICLSRENPERLYYHAVLPKSPYAMRFLYQHLPDSKLSPGVMKTMESLGSMQGMRQYVSTIVTLQLSE